MTRVRLAALAAVLLGSCLWCAGALAQVYRIVGPDGRVTFSDRPPPDAKATPAKTLPLGADSASGSTPLPAELRAVTARFPVVLYTGVDCAPCVSARNFLLRRGVPFTEKTVSSEDDIQALQRLAGAARLPFTTIGGQHIRGFSDAEWSEYLDAAGYPKVSVLPPTYRNPEPTPMVAVQTQTKPKPAAAAEPAPSAQLPPPSGPTADNPAGIRF